MKPFAKPPTKLVVHCTASPNGQVQDMVQLKIFHTTPEPKGRGFSDIGYHWIIQPDGKICTGRNENFTGAGVKGHNSYTLHIALVGTDKFTKAAWGSLAYQVMRVQQAYPSIKEICGHRDFSPDKDKDGVIEPNEWIKLCPSFDVKSWLKSGMMPIPNQTL